MKTHSWNYLSFLRIVLITAMMACAVPISEAQAQFTSPPDRGAPKGTAGGGSRPLQRFCLQDPTSQETLIAMAPTGFTGVTMQQHPTVWVYVPRTTAKTLEFSLFTSKGEGVYQTNLPITASGLLKITVPSTSAALATGQPYTWTAALVCDAKRRTKDWSVKGQIQQQPLTADLQRQLTGAAIDQKIKQYVQAGFWYDALTIYLEGRQTQLNAKNRSPLWAELLKTAGLTTIAEPPITQATR